MEDPKWSAKRAARDYFAPYLKHTGWPKRWIADLGRLAAYHSGSERQLDILLFILFDEQIELGIAVVSQFQFFGQKISLLKAIGDVLIPKKMKKDFDALTKILEGSNAGRNKIFHNSIEGTLDNPDPVLGGVKKIKLSKTSRADDKPYSVNLKEIKNASALCRSAIAACWAFRVKIVRSQFAQHNTSPEKSP